MRVLGLIGLAAALTFAGCSKTEEDPTVAETTEGAPASAGTAPAGANPGLASALNTVTSDIEAKQYDAAVQKLLEAKIAAQQSDADQELYDRKYREAQNALREQAEVDPNAKASYENLGRAMMGR